jgi:hypothetical protein
MYDGGEVSAKSKKKKKPKYPGHKAPQSASESYTLMAGKVRFSMATPLIVLLTVFVEVVHSADVLGCCP